MTNQTSAKPAALLLVESDEDASRALIAKLTKDGHQILHVTDSDQAIEILSSKVPTAILYAPIQHTPDRLTLITKIRSIDRYATTPLLVLSHDLSDSELINAMDRGATDFILRPFHIAELRARVRSAIRTSQMIRLLEHRARIDPLTALWNRLYFTERLSAAIATSQRSNDPLAVVIIDIDHFKSINDTYGHAVGDAVLQDFATVLRKSIRAGDTACRYGGEEFAVILPRADAEQAIAFCQRFRSMLEATKWPSPITNRITASLGITTVGLNNEQHLQAWVEAADKALYAAKQSGRDRVHIFKADTSDPTTIRKAG